MQRKHKQDCNIGTFSSQVITWDGLLWFQSTWNLKLGLFNGSPQYVTNPNDSDNPLTFHLVPPPGQGLHLLSKIAQHLIMDWHNISDRYECFPDNVSLWLCWSSDFSHSKDNPESASVKGHLVYWSFHPTEQSHEVTVTSLKLIH